jgi:hypothetical protein
LANINEYVKNQVKFGNEKEVDVMDKSSLVVDIKK